MGTKTIGDAIEKKVQKSFKLWQQLKNDQANGRDIDPELATYDLQTEVYIAERALERLRELMTTEG